MKFFTQLLCKHDYRLRRIRRSKRKRLYNEKMYYCSKCGKRKRNLEEIKDTYWNSWYKFKTKTGEKLK